MKIINRISHKSLESNLPYPLNSGYTYVAKLDKEWVNSRLNARNVDRINNKYCVNLDVGSANLLVTNHDGTYWLTIKT